MKRTKLMTLTVCLLICTLVFCSCGGSSGPKMEAGDIYLYGEEHSNRECLTKELELWGELYSEGVRDLFVELPCYTAEYLNLWMLADLEAAGEKDSDAYKLAEEVIEQGKTFYEMYANDDPADTYRENCMAENFIREYSKISGATIMGIYGGASYGWSHVNPELTYDATRYGLDESYSFDSMAKQLAAVFGDKLHCEDLL